MDIHSTLYPRSERVQWENTDLHPMIFVYILQMSTPTPKKQAKTPYLQICCSSRWQCGCSNLLTCLSVVKRLQVVRLRKGPLGFGLA